MIDFILGDGSGALWLLLKLALLIGLLLYMIFAYVVIKQVKLMNETLEVGFENGMKILSYVHMGAVIVILVLAVIIL